MSYSAGFYIEDKGEAEFAHSMAKLWGTNVRFCYRADLICHELYFSVTREYFGRMFGGVITEEFKRRMASWQNQNTQH